ncbi:antibiotic biosynthesis monooxygenase [Sporosarcina sp. Sa2YVA2]|uniref:Antibiotic biosynthesis monooxygenase n=1 Tax=Sporosarcina quadrami TaxID=2762234 RepID=A0ABR8UA42_9BACL|nr:antibiotic biosynthesis monooxygenase family protein [Sporosarcina quadrami]MBD7984920.1 antibiotic biosynthesis monooxygenase [Sporosarcina quadrami]
MHIVNSTFQVPPEKAEEVIGIYKGRSKRVDQAEGFVSFQLLQNQKRPGELVVHMEWASNDQYLNWVRSSEFKEIHELEKKYPDQELASIIPKVAQYKVVAN